MMKQAPGMLAGRPVEATALAPLAVLTRAVFLDLTDRHFKSYAVLDQLRGGGESHRPGDR
jgi:hypothetical protein